ncbi:MAG: hypothetical protein PHQ03_04835 [Methylococcales bacterium]|nr:hypothetical protein [Methylococcales bacterium]
MGAYIHIGLCTKISFSKKHPLEIKKHFQNIDEFKDVIEKEKNLVMAHFDWQEIDEAYIFTLNPELLSPAGLLTFLDDFLSYLHIDTPKEEFEFLYRDFLNKIALATSAQEIIDCAKNRDDYDIRLNRDYESLGHIESKPFFNIDNFQIDYIPLFHQGKAMLEVYNPLFSYIERLIRVKHTQPQASVIKLFLE